MDSPREPLQFGDSRFPRSSRLRLERRFTHVRHHGRTVAGRLQVMGFAPAPDGQTRVGVIAGRRYHRRAVRRNRARRQLREAFRLLQGALTKPTWVVLIARRDLLRAKTQDVQAELLRLLEKAGLLPPRP